MVLEQLCEDEAFTDFLYTKKFHGEVANGLIGKWQIIALKPQTFMNKSGASIQAIVNYYKIAPTDILVFQDDIDIDFGRIKLKFAGSAWWHNGVRDIENKLGTKDFWRLKLWVGRPAHPSHDIADYVLSKFSATEQKRRQDHEYDIRERVGLYLKNTG